MENVEIIDSLICRFPNELYMQIIEIADKLKSLKQISNKESIKNANPQYRKVLREISIKIELNE